MAAFHGNLGMHMCSRALVRRPWLRKLSCVSCLPLVHALRLVHQQASHQISHSSAKDSNGTSLDSPIPSWATDPKSDLSMLCTNSPVAGSCRRHQIRSAGMPKPFHPSAQPHHRALLATASSHANHCNPDCFTMTKLCLGAVTTNR